MGDDRIDGRGAGRLQRLGAGHQRAARRHDIVDQQRRPSVKQRRIGKRDFDRTVATARFARHRTLHSEPGGEIAHPGLRLLVRTDHHRLWIETRAQSIGDRRHGRQIVGLDAGKYRANVFGAMQMGVNGDYAVHRIRQQPADDFLVDRFAWMEGRVLPHVTEIGRHQHQPPRAAAPQCFRCEQQRHQLLIRLVKRRIDDGGRRRRSGGDAQLSIRETMQRDFMQRHAKPRRQPGRHARRRRQALQDRGHGFISREPTT